MFAGGREARSQGCRTSSLSLQRLLLTASVTATIVPSTSLSLVGIVPLKLAVKACQNQMLHWSLDHFHFTVVKESVLFFLNKHFVTSQDRVSNLNICVIL